MSLPKTLKHAQNKLDEAEGLMQLHTEEVVQALTDEVEYRGSYADKLIQSYVGANRASNNAETQFFNYEKGLEKMLKGENLPEEVAESYDIPPDLQQYQHAFTSASNISNRSERLERQFEALSTVMKQNGMEDILQRMTEQHPWYSEPEASGIQSAAEI